jgi:polysaccharide export outer membrane protein
VNIVLFPFFLVVLLFWNGLMAYLVECFRRGRWLLPLLAVSMSGCSLLPGMYASYDKKPKVLESAQEPATIDYSLLQVTPLLVRQLNEQFSALQLPIKGQLPPPKVPSHPYRLGPQDTLRIFVWGHPDLTPVTSNVTTAGFASTPAGRTIDNNGNLFFPMVGQIRASGMTINEFRVRLSKALSAYIPDPQVEVDVAGFRSQRIFVAGAVRSPGAISVTDQPLKVTDALSSAGGALENADLYDVVLTRGNRSVRLDLDSLYYNGRLESNVLLADGDILSVPDRQTRKIFMLGEVGNSVGSNQARSYVMRRGRMTLTEVLSDAGGASPFSAATNEIYVLRVDPTATSSVEAARLPIVYQINLTNPESLVLADQFPMLPRDVIFVNPTGPTMIGRFLGQFLPVFSTVNAANGASPF